MEKENFDERSYTAALSLNEEEAVSAALLAFSEFGFWQNFRIIAGRAVNLDYRTDENYLPVRIVHHSKHLNRFTSGRETQLPLLHAVSLMSGRTERRVKEPRGGSLTDRQIIFELVSSLERNETGRAEGITVEIISRGMFEELMGALRDEAVRRYSYVFPAFNLWNAVRCIISDAPVYTGGSLSMLRCLSGSGVSNEYISVRRAIGRAELKLQAAMENSYIPDESVDAKIISALRCGVPELALRIILDMVSDGISLNHILSVAFREMLVQSQNSGRKSLFEFLIQNCASLIEVAISGSDRSEILVYELLLTVFHLTQISVPSAAKHPSVEGYDDLNTSLSDIEGGTSERISSILRSKHNASVNDRIAEFLAMSSAKYDQLKNFSEAICHCSSVLTAGRVLGGDSVDDCALDECASYLSKLFSTSDRPTCSIYERFRIYHKSGSRESN
jgi:hypothetical protein